MEQLLQAGLLKGSAATIYQQPISELIRSVKVTDEEVIRPFHRPYHAQGGLAILYGNLAMGGAVAKIAGIPDKMRYHKGPAVVFADGEIATEEILNGRVKPGDVVVIRYEGPKGGPGMREMLSPTSAMVGMGLIERVALITDGRFSGGSVGNVIGHVSPEAAEGGVIAVVQNGDPIEIDIEKRQINLLIAADEIQARINQLPPFKQKNENQFLRRYSHFVQSADSGAIFKEVE
jgi:dihydroxy-acid dehydratase